MGRKKIPAVHHAMPAPKELPAGAKKIWQRIVDSKASDFFNPGDEDHLVAYVWAAWKLRLEVARDARKNGTGDRKVIEQCTAAMARLGPQLRITISARMEPRTAGSSNRRRAQEGPPAGEAESATTPAGDWRSRVGRGKGLPQ